MVQLGYAGCFELGRGEHIQGRGMSAIEQLVWRPMH